MTNFMNLVYNELFKTYIRKSTWIMYIILFTLIVGFGLLNKTFGDYAGLDYGAWEFTIDNGGMLSVLGLFMIIIASGMVAHEFRWGTIKLLLIRPISRTKILFSKYVALLAFSVITMLFMIIVAWIVGALAFGIDSLSGSVEIQTQIFSSMETKSVTTINELVATYGYGMIDLIMMTTFAFMISAVFRNSSLAIGVSIFLLLTGSTLVAIFANRAFAKYILFAHSDLSMYRTDSVFVDGITMPFSITILLIYYVVFMFFAWLFFTKRDVAGQ